MYKKTVALPGRLDAYYSAKDAGSADRLEAILYPSPLLTVKTMPLPESMEYDELQRTSITTYTKHYYIGSERIASALGTMKNLGLLCEVVWPGDQTIITEIGTKTIAAGNALIADYFSFEKDLHLPEPYLYETYICADLDHHPENYDAYWYHPDHLGSSNYITNLAGMVNQHMEYLPFGETLVEEHLNSYNSPYKFNAKEFDAETGWYYYGARYYNPKWSIWLSVDPLAERAPDWSPYRAFFNNPTNYIDPDGLFEWRVNSETGDYERIGDKGGNEYQHIYFNDNKEATEVLKGGKIYVGAAADNRYKDGEISFAVSTKDLWSDLPDEYRGAYTRGDLVERYRAQMEGGDKYDLIRSQEAQGLARRDQIWNIKDLRNDVIEKMGNDSGLALAAYTGMLQTIVDLDFSGPSLPRSAKRTREFSPVFTPRTSQLSNNSWIRFLQVNKGKYKGLGKNWIYQAAKDYKSKL